MLGAKFAVTIVSCLSVCPASAVALIGLSVSVVALGVAVVLSLVLVLAGMPISPDFTEGSVEL